MRRLSAIMFTDIVGYSALTQQNEAQALRMLETHRAMLRPLFLEYEGREIETDSADGPWHCKRLTGRLDRSVDVEVGPALGG